MSRGPRAADVMEAYDRVHSAGAVALNTYEVSRTDLVYDYTKVDAELPRYIIWFRKALYIVQIAIMCGAGVITVGAIMAERNGLRFNKHQIPFGRMDNELLYVPWACGGISTITAIIGCFGAQFRNKCGRCMLIAYLIGLVISLSLAVGSTAQTFADQSNVYNYALRQWRALTATQERVFEWDHLCCNFITIPPCCRFEPSAERYCINEYVCFEQVQPHLLEQFELIKITSMIQSVILAIVLVFAAALCILLQCKENRKQKKLEDGDGNTVKKETKPKPKLITSYTTNKKRETDTNIKRETNRNIKREINRNNKRESKHPLSTNLERNLELTANIKRETNKRETKRPLSTNLEKNLEVTTNKNIKKKRKQNIKRKSNKNIKRQTKKTKKIKKTNTNPFA